MNKKILFLLFASLLDGILFSQPGSFCGELKKSFDENKIKYTVQTLSYSANEDFPYNLIVKKDAETDFISEKDGKLCTLAIIIPQNNVKPFQTEILHFLSQLDKTPLHFNVEVVFTANDYTIIPPPENQNFLSGTTTYLHNLNSMDNLYVAIISSENEESPQVPLFTFVAKNKATSEKYVKKFLQSFKKTNTSFDFYPSSVGFERLGAVKADAILEMMLENEIPAVHFTISNEIFGVLEYFIANNALDAYDEWDSQYALFTKKPIIIPQTFFIALLFFDIVTAVFLLCFSFFLGNYISERKKEFLKTLYQPFLIIAFFLASLYIAQILTKNLFSSYQQGAIIAFCIKIILSAVIFNFFTKSFIFIPFFSNDYIFGFWLTFTSFANIIIFSLSDLSFTINFTLFYIFVIISRFSKRKSVKIICLWLMMVSFIPLLITNEQKFNEIFLFLTDGNLLKNLYISLFVTPFVLLSLQLNVDFGNFKSHKLSDIKNNKKHIITNIIVAFCCVAFVIALIPITNVIYKKVVPIKQSVQICSAECTAENSVGITSTQKFTFSKQNVKIGITAGKNTIRYSVKVRSSSPMPIYNANYPFDAFTEQNTIIFSFEEFPPAYNELLFSASQNQDYEIEVTTYSFKDEFTIEKTIQKFLLEGKRKNERTI